MKKLEKYLLPLGMAGVLLYLAHTILGNVLREGYNPITMDISSLTADGAPHAELLKVLGFIYGVCMILMVVALMFKAFTHYHSMLRIGFCILMIMQLTSLVGYSLFPLTGDKTETNLQNTMHIVVTVVVVLTTVTSSFLISLGYLKQEKKRMLGKFTLVMAILITIFGVMNPIVIHLELNILGLTERLAIYSIQALMFVISFYYTFVEKPWDEAINK